MVNFQMFKLDLETAEEPEIKLPTSVGSSKKQEFQKNICFYKGFPCSSVGKESTCSAGDAGSIPRLGRAPGEGNGNQLQYPFLENLMDRGAWWAAVHGVAKSRTQQSD